MTSAYFIINIESVEEPAKFDKYRQRAPATVAAHGGEYQVVGGNPLVLEGKWAPGTLVTICFPDRDRAQAWWDSPEYAPLKSMRQESAHSTFVLVDGTDS